MRLVKLGLACVDTTVGAFGANTDRAVETARAMAAEDVTVACFPEQVLGGYPPEDLVQWHAFLAAHRAALDRFAQGTGELATVFVVGSVVGLDGHVFNTSAVVHRGRILGHVPKEKLPTYEVFYESRTLSRGGPGLALELDGVPLGDHVFRFDFGTVAAEVCEDSWTPDGPMRRRCFSGAEIVTNVSASPYRVGHEATRREMFSTRSADNEAVVVYVNAIGAQDGLVFDGGGYVIQSGRMMLDAPRFREGWWSTVVDLDRTRRLRRENTTWRTDAEAFRRENRAVPILEDEAATADRDGLRYPGPSGDSFFLPPDEDRTVNPRTGTLDELYEALSLGLAGYMRQTRSFTGIGVALSGGRDSLLSLLVAWRAIQRLNGVGAASAADADTTTPPDHGAAPTPDGYAIHAFYMPSRHSRKETADAARTIAEELDVVLHEQSIDEALDREIEAARNMLGGEDPSDVTVENIQARIRGTRMWNWANSSGALFLQTGDMSEKAVGYTTIGGDLEGGFSPIANLPKTVVVALLERLHERFGFEGIRKTLDTEAGPELADDQTAEAELMPFRVLDACLHLYAGEKLSADEVAAVLPDLFPDEDPDRLRDWARRFAGMFTRSIYKWVQSPLTVHVGRMDLERERAMQLPVVQELDW